MSWHWQVLRWCKCWAIRRKLAFDLLPWRRLQILPHGSVPVDEVPDVHVLHCDHHDIHWLRRCSSGQTCRCGDILQSSLTGLHSLCMCEESQAVENSSDITIVRSRVRICHAFASDRKRVRRHLSRQRPQHRRQSKPSQRKKPRSSRRCQGPHRGVRNSQRAPSATPKMDGRTRRMPAKSNCRCCMLVALAKEYRV